MHGQGYPSGAATLPLAMHCVNKETPFDEATRDDRPQQDGQSAPCTARARAPRRSPCALSQVRVCVRRRQSGASAEQRRRQRCVRSSGGLPQAQRHLSPHVSPYGPSVMVANGVSLRAVQTIGGWSTLRMVEPYAHVDVPNFSAPFASRTRIPKTRAQERPQRRKRRQPAPIQPRPIKREQ